MITRAAAELVARCLLPESIVELEEIGPMRDTVAKGKALVGREKKAGIYDQGERRALTKILELLSGLIEQDLKQHLKIRPKSRTHL